MVTKTMMTKTKLGRTTKIDAIASEGTSGPHAMKPAATEAPHSDVALRSAPAPGNQLRTGVLNSVRQDGMLLVKDDSGVVMACLWLDSGRTLSPPLSAGDRVLVSFFDASLPPVALGRVGRYPGTQPPDDLMLEASQSVTMRCGNASLTLQSDGRVLLKGEDVVVRAKGTKRIRAGHVAIN